MRTAALLSLLLLVVLPCCDDDDNGGFEPEPIFWELTSPENVLHNLAACHKEMDNGQLAPLFHDDFHFVFWPDDIPEIPPDIIENGMWYKEAMLDALGNMLDTTYVPPYDPDYRTRSTSLAFELDQDLEETSVDGAPPGTLNGRAYLELRVETTSGALVTVNSRPIFHFAPDSTAAEVPGGVTWSIWRVDDAPPSGSSNLRASQGSATPLPPEPPSWGIFLCLYASRAG